MRPSLRALFSQLSAEGLVAAEDERRFREVLVTRVEQQTPWYLQLLMGAGAWIATGLFLLFLFVADLMDEEAVVGVVGLGMVGAALVLRLRRAAPMLVQLALAASLVGQGMVVTASSALARGDELPAVVALCLSLVLIGVFPDPVHRFLSTLASTTSVAFLAVEWDQRLLADGAFALLAVLTVAWWLRRPVLSGLEAQLTAPVGNGLVVSLLGAAVPLGILRDEGPWVLGTLALAGMAVFVQLRLFGIPGRKLDRVVLGSLAATVLLAAVSHQVPGLLAALLIMLIATQRRDPLLLGEAVFAFVFFLGWYYYSLDVTLLQKSAALVISGGVLLAAWRLLPRAPVPSGSSS
ncbi:MAG: DUF4401 domain-containing protein [Myxococcota bacterium]|nr:DUF4401 domain-containing protein [Myxococcota bacterium]